VQQLPLGYRTVFNMFVIDGYSHKEISDYLSINENTSKSQLFKARKQLQVWLKDWF
jgi:DNA-directed RNA polymerase specialized sigma24 family protein